MPRDDLLRRGDPDAFSAFYRDHAPALLGWLVRRTRDPEAAADLCAETFAAALRGCRGYDPSKGPAVGWLYGIARNQLASAARRGAVEDRARRRLGMEPIELSDVAVERVEALAATTEVLAALPADQRDAIRARVIEERGYAEIAAALRTSESVVRKRVSRGLAGLRERLGEESR
jgi:RNA polymerase sigma factor (sigma-70 family)